MQLHPKSEDENSLSCDPLRDHIRHHSNRTPLNGVLKATARAVLLGAVVGGGTALAPQATQAQVEYTERPGTNNPFDGIDVGDKSAPQVVDFDGDGDLDIAIGRSDGTVGYFENTGSSTSPSYTQRTGSNNPFDGFDLGDDAVVDFGDVDGDGDLDLVAGKSAGTLAYFENTGSSTSPSYTQRTGSDNPFSGFDLGDNSAPKLADFEGDGDLDAIIGRADGTLAYLENTGSTTSPSYTQRTGTDNPFDGADFGDDSVPGIADVDGDGDLDIAVGKNLPDQENSIAYFENNGSATSPSYTHRIGSDNPFDGFAGTDSAPVFGDVDGDGDLDVPVGARDGQIRYLEHTGDVTRTAMYSDATDNPFEGNSVTGNSTPTEVDLDADGDLDVVVGKDDGTLVYLENTGTATDPVYEARLGSENPFDGFDFGDNSAPLAVDYEGDGDFDMAVGRADGSVGYLENTGSATNPSFTKRTGSDNPFSELAVAGEAKLAQADLDGDQDLDIIAGKDAGTLMYFENTGSMTNPSYTQRTGSDNPFDGFDVGDNSAPSASDVDNDGDIDVVAGALDGSLAYFENTGSETSPSFTQRTGMDNPFANASVGGGNAPRFADLDHDNDPDLILGTSAGDLDAYQFGTSDTLPVELTDFIVQADGKAAILTWSTASERNNAGFEVQRMLGDEGASGSGMYEGLGFVEGAKTTDESQSYRFRTKELDVGTHRFRLKQVDTDGSTEYSETKTLKITLDSAYRLAAPSPNPSRGSAQIALTVEKKQSVQVRIFDLLGRRVATVFGGSIAAQQKRNFEIGDGLAPGAYFVEVNGERFRASEKFVIVE